MAKNMKKYFIFSLSTNTLVHGMQKEEPKKEIIILVNRRFKHFYSSDGYANTIFNPLFDKNKFNIITMGYSYDFGNNNERTPHFYYYYEKKYKGTVQGNDGKDIDGTFIEDNFYEIEKYPNTNNIVAIYTDINQYIDTGNFKASSYEINKKLTISEFSTDVRIFFNKEITCNFYRIKDIEDIGDYKSVLFCDKFISNRKEISFLPKSYIKKVSNFAAIMKFKNFSGAFYLPDDTRCFENCATLEKLKIDTLFFMNKELSLKSMFLNCYSLTEIDLDSIYTGDLLDISYMFAGCISLKDIKLDFVAPNLKNISHMFDGCTELKKVKFTLLGYNLTDMSAMFSNCKNLVCADFFQFYTNKVLYMTKMFSGCSNLKEVDLSCFEAHKYLNVDGMFDGCGQNHELEIKATSFFNTQNLRYEISAANKKIKNNKPINTEISGSNIKEKSVSDDNNSESSIGLQLTSGNSFLARGDIKDYHPYSMITTNNNKYKKNKIREKGEYERFVSYKK